MAYEIVRAHKLKYINQLDNTTDHSLAHSTISYIYDKLNENTEINSKNPLTAETYSRTIFSLEDKPSNIIKKEYASKPYS